MAFQNNECSSAVSVYAFPCSQPAPAELPDAIPATIISYAFTGNYTFPNSAVDNVGSALDTIDEFLSCINPNYCALSTAGTVLHYDGVLDQYVPRDLNALIQSYLDTLSSSGSSDICPEVETCIATLIATDGNVLTLAGGNVISQPLETAISSALNDLLSTPGTYLTGSAGGAVISNFCDDVAACPTSGGGGGTTLTDPGDFTFVNAASTETEGTLLEYLDDQAPVAALDCPMQLIGNPTTGAWEYHSGIPVHLDYPAVVVANTATTTPDQVPSEDIGMIARLNPTTNCIEWVDDREVSDVVLTVPGDFSTLQAASDYLSNKTYRQATILLTTNLTESPSFFGLTGGITLIDLAGNIITGRTQVRNSTNVNIRNGTFNGTGQIAALNIDNSTAVALQENILTVGGGFGLGVRGSQVYMSPGATLTARRATDFGVFLAQGGTFDITNGTGGVFITENRIGIRLQEASQMIGTNGTNVPVQANDNTAQGLYATDGARYVIRTESTAHSYSNNGLQGILAENALVIVSDPTGVTVEDNGSSGIDLRASDFHAEVLFSRRNGGGGLVSTYGSRSEVLNGSFLTDNALWGAGVFFNSTYLGDESTYSDNTLDGISIGSGSYARALNSSANNNGGWGVQGSGNATYRVAGLTGGGNASGLIDNAFGTVGPSEEWLEI